MFIDIVSKYIGVLMFSKVKVDPTFTNALLHDECLSNQYELGKNYYVVEILEQVRDSILAKSVTREIVTTDLEGIFLQLILSKTTSGY